MVVQSKVMVVLEAPAPKQVFKRGEKLEINPLLLQAFEITPEELGDVIKSAEEPEAMRDMFAFMSDYATLSHPETRPLISDDKLDFLVADLKRRMGRVAELYREQAIEYGKLSGFMEKVKVPKLQVADKLQKISEEARKLSAFSGQTRTDKIAFIDAVMHLEHTSGSVLPVAFGITDYGREEYWPRKLLAFLRTHGMPGMVREGTAPDAGKPNIIFLPLEQAWQMRAKHAHPGTMEPKRTTEAMERLRNELKQGRFEPIPATQDELRSGILTEGKHRLIVARELGIKQVPIKIIGGILMVKESITSEPADKEFRADPNLINKNLAMRSHSGTSWDPEKRGIQEIAAFVSYVQEIYERLKKHAKTDQQKEYLLKEMERFQSSFAGKYNAKLSAQGGCLSTMIAGPSNFPVRRAEKACSAADKRYEEMIEFKDRAEAAILRELKKMGVEEAGGELEVLKKKIADAERNHEFMVKTNVIVRKKIPDDQKIREIMALGKISEATVREILKPDYMGRIGFPAYALSNDTANIHRMKERLKELEKREVTPTAEITFPGGYISDNREEDRVQIFFDQKPPQAMIDKLKSEGWRWAPSVGAWSRKRTENALYSAKRITGASPVTQPPAHAVPSPAPIVHPLADVMRPSPYALPELRWVYGTRDEKWHLVGPEDRDYAQGITQARMRQIGQEAARAEYLSPSLARAPAQQVPPTKHPPMLYPAQPQRSAEEIMFVPNPETMTKEEYVKEKYRRMAQVLRQQGKNAIAERVEKGARDPERTFKYETSHRDQVVLALAQGKTVGGNVLKDYPDIVANIQKVNEEILAKIKTDREQIKAAERAEENTLNAELNQLPPALKRHAETEIYGTLHLPETHKDYRNRFYIALGKVRRIAYSHLPGRTEPQPPVLPQVRKEEPVEPLLPEQERVIKTYLEKRGHELTLREFVWADKYTIRGTAKYPIRTMEEKRKREEFVSKNYDEETGKKYHRGTVESALKRGIKVPDEVLKDYPDLIAKKKEPWEMTQEEYWRSGAGGKAYEGRGTSDYNHKQAVYKAISDGKPVSPNVLKDYPDLRTLGLRGMIKKEVPAVPPGTKKFVQRTFQVEERMRRYGYGY